MYNYIKYRNFFKNAALFSGSPQCYAKGNFFKLPIPFPSIYIVNDIHVLRHILITNEEKYEKSKIYWKQLRHVIGNCMGSTEGDEWLHLRKLQNPFFTKTAVNNYLFNIAERANSFVAKLQSQENFIPAKDFSNVYIRIILNNIFGVDEEKDTAMIHNYIENGEYLIMKRSQYPWRPYTTLFSKEQTLASQSLKHLLHWTKSKLKERNEKKDFFSDTLMDALVKDGRSKTEIRNELIVHLGAGTETAAISSMWTLYTLSQNPEYLKKVQQEVDAIVEKELEPHHIEKLIFLEQCIKESLRMYPPSHAIVRDAIAKDNINGTKIKKSDILYISAYGIHHNPGYWQNPENFNPERFSANNEKNIQQYSYIPFAAGKHACIGRYLALPMMKACIAVLLKQYNIFLLNKEKVNPVSLSTLKSDREIIFNLKKRS